MIYLKSRILYTLPQMGRRDRDRMQSVPITTTVVSSNPVVASCSRCIM
jgi:hypothetical protein